MYIRFQKKTARQYHWTSCRTGFPKSIWQRSPAQCQNYGPFKINSLFSGSVSHLLLHYSQHFSLDGLGYKILSSLQCSDLASFVSASPRWPKRSRQQFVCSGAAFRRGASCRDWPVGRQGRPLRRPRWPVAASTTSNRKPTPSTVAPRT